MRKKSVRDLSDEQVRGKRALVRVDFNVPLDEDGQITDDTRIRASLPTIELLLERNARPIILSHLGRPKGKPNPKYSLQPVSKRLEELTGCKVNFVESTDSDEALQACQNLQSGEILSSKIRASSEVKRRTIHAWAELSPSLAIFSSTTLSAPHTVLTPPLLGSPSTCVRPS